MLKELKKIWYDTTTYQSKYVAKDVMKMGAYLTGLFALFVSLMSPVFKVTISTEVGYFLMAFALGGSALKEHYKTKNNAIAADCPNASAPTDTDINTDDNEPEKSEKDDSSKNAIGFQVNAKRQNS